MTNQLSADEARRLSRQCLGNCYDETCFRQFAANLLPDAERLDERASVGNYVPKAFRDYIISFKRLAKTRENSREKLDVLVVKLKKASQLLNARSMQRQFIARYLNGARDNVYDGAIVAFHSDESRDWRLSLVYKDQIFSNGKVVSTLSEPKRASYIVGPNELSHTAEKQFVDLLQDQSRSQISRIREAFSVEAVTDEFFNEYRELFLELKETIDGEIKENPAIAREFEEKGIKSQVYAKRMLGQIIFLYFLQKKGWLGVQRGQKWGTGSHAFLKELFAANQDQDFFNDFLNPLFYDALATDRSANDHFFKLLGCRIPFLNGGLFEPLHGYDWRKFRLHIPNSFFTRLFEVFDRFNFTVREDEPLESEVAVDPEMLGKVFEKLLSVEERRHKGTYYTPRPIVHYMCRESLALYLDRTLNLDPVYESKRDILPGLPNEERRPALPGIKTRENTSLRMDRVENVPMADIEALLRQDEAIAADDEKADNKKKASDYSTELSASLPDTVQRNARRMDEALAKIKICDPAIGSGAFAVGMMHEIVRLRMALRDGCPGAGLKTCTPYELKRETIANSLYGVDVDPSAVDVAKLRLWLSLVVDENDYDQIKPLPNLDYKIMSGNSLDAFHSTQDENPLLNRERCGEILKLQGEYFSLTDRAEKMQLARKIASLRAQCGNIGGFDWQLDFFDAAGKFDIVLGNPPYIQIQSMDPATKALKPMYKCFENTGDVYCLFYELGINLLKKHGTLALITSNKWMRAAYGKALRDYFLAHTTPLKLVDFAGHKVFDDATVDVNIMILEKDKSDTETGACVIRENCANNMSSYIGQNSVFTRFEVGQSWAILSPIEQSIKRKIEAVGKPLKEWDVKIYRGVLTGCNEAFIIDGAKKDELIVQDPKSAEIIRPILRGRDIKRYGYEFADKWLIATFPSRHYDIEEYPAVKNHLLSFGIERLEQTGKTHIVNGQKVKARKKTNNKWFETQDSISYWEDFNKQKIIWADIANGVNTFYLDRTKFFISNTCYMLISPEENILKYIMAYLNSNVTLFYISILSSSLGDKGFRWFKEFVELLPVYWFNCKEIRKLITGNLNYENNQQNEMSINYFFYKLYNLSFDEKLFLDNLFIHYSLI